ncbi:hypothetical protein [Microbacterium sp. HSID17254]|uniref:hypothetical protein n=1 Tax=Microbacterium sp. HSID17254 TaxID=2419509 RepID=UPI0013867CA4|nr:hypothetical protein [Microbacterium sp. HSID17254]
MQERHSHRCRSPAERAGEVDAEVLGLRVFRLARRQLGLPFEPFIVRDGTDRVFDILELHGSGRPLLDRVERADQIGVHRAAMQHLGLTAVRTEPAPADLGDDGVPPLARVRDRRRLRRDLGGLDVGHALLQR